MKYTNKHNFNLPESADNVDIAKINENFQKIDGELGHPNIETNSPTDPSTDSPGFGGKIAVVTNMNRDTNGHVTNFEVKLLELPKSCANTGTFTHNTANITIDTGFTDTPKLFRLYYTTDGETVELAVECRPGLDAPFNLINNSGLPINSVDFEGGTATINAATSTGLSMMWEAYI